MVRCLKDKAPKGNYIIRATVLDRLVDNKLYYKFIEYGNKIKEEQEIKREKDEEERKLEEIRRYKEEEDRVLNPNFSDKSLQQVSSRDNLSARPAERKKHIFDADSDDENQQLNQPSARVVGFGTQRHDVAGGGDHDISKSVDIDDDYDEENKGKVGPKDFSEFKVPILTKDYSKYHAMKTQYGANKVVEDLKEKYDNVEKVLIDFGKQYTKLVHFDGLHNSDELNYDGYKMYFIVPPNLYLEPSNVVLFELIWLSSQTTS